MERVREEEQYVYGCHTQERECVRIYSGISKGERERERERRVQATAAAAAAPAVHVCVWPPPERATLRTESECIQ